MAGRMRERLIMREQILDLLDENAVDVVAGEENAQSKLNATNEMAKVRILSKIKTEIIPPQPDSVGWISFRPGLWVTAACSVLILSALVYYSRSVKIPSAFSVTVAQGQERRNLDLSKQGLSLTGDFAIVRNSEIEIRGDKLESVPLRVADVNELGVRSGRFVVTYNRNHTKPPLVFRCGEYRIMVVGTIFGIEYLGPILRVGVAEGEIRVLDANGVGQSVPAGVLWTHNASKQVPPITSRISNDIFLHIFSAKKRPESDPKQSKKTHAIREIEVREAPSSTENEQ